MLPLPFMSFLRPLPLPCLTSVNLLQRRLLSSPCHRKGGNEWPSDATNKCSSTNVRLPAAATVISSALTPSSVTPAVKPSTQIDQAALPPLPYHVHRTPSQKLPIYHLAKRGGNLHQTRIRKIQGNVEKLREEIVAALALREENVVINRLTGHIILKVP